MRKLLAITFVSLLLTGSVFASVALKPKNCSATQSSQARVAGKDVKVLGELAKKYVEESKKSEGKTFAE